MGRATALFFGPRPFGPWGGVKSSNNLKFQLQSQFQRLLNQTLYVFSQTKYIKTHRTGFSSVCLGHAPGMGLGGAVGGGGSQICMSITLSRTKKHSYCIHSEHCVHVHVEQKVDGDYLDL